MTLKARGFVWIDAEPAPVPLSPELARHHGYGLFLSRTSNIYTARQLRQWLDWAIEPKRMSTETWAMEGRWFDPFRPRVEPGGFRSHDKLLASRLTVLRCLREAIETADMFVFTLGPTECLRNSKTG